MTVLVKVSRLMTRMIMVLARSICHTPVAMPLFIQIAGRMAGMWMMVARNFTSRGVSMTMLVNISARVPRMIVVLFVGMIGHD